MGHGPADVGRGCNETSGVALSFQRRRCGRRCEPDRRARAANGTDRPLPGAGTGTGTTITNLATLAVTFDGTGQQTHFGSFTYRGAAQLTITGANSFTFAGTETHVAANGDMLFSTLQGAGTFTATTSETTVVNTVTAEPVASRRQVGRSRPR